MDQSTLTPLTRTDHGLSSVCGGTNVGHASAPSFHANLSTVLNCAVKLKLRLYYRRVANVFAVCASSVALSPFLGPTGKILLSQYAEGGVTVPQTFFPYTYTLHLRRRNYTNSTKEGVFGLLIQAGSSTD